MNSPQSLIVSTESWRFYEQLIVDLIGKKTSNFGGPDVPTWQYSFLIKRRYHLVNEMMKLKTMWYVSVVLEPFISLSRTSQTDVFINDFPPQYFPAVYANQMLVHSTALV